MVVPFGEDAASPPIGMRSVMEIYAQKWIESIRFWRFVRPITKLAL